MSSLNLNVAGPIVTEKTKTPGRGLNIFLWVLQISAAAMFLMAGSTKLAGAEQMIRSFDIIGLGQWFRYVTGGIEVLAAVLLLVPGFSGIGALLLAATMIGAIATHLFIIGGSSVIPIVLLAVTAFIAWNRKEQISSLLHKLIALK